MPTTTTSGRRSTRTFLTLRRRGVARRLARAASRPAARRVVIAGRVAGAHGGRVTIRLIRRGPGRRWKLLSPRKIGLGTRGKFRLELGLQRRRWLRVQAIYEGSATAAPSRSKPLNVRS